MTQQKLEVLVYFRQERRGKVSIDIGKEIHFTTKEREQIERNLATPIQVLWAGSCGEIYVPDYDFGRALVSGDDSLLKTAIEEKSRDWGVGKLKSDRVEFQILDFTRFRQPETVLDEAMSEIPNIRKVNSTIEGRDFNDFYPGKIMVIIGAGTIPQQANAFDLNVIARTAPTIFIRKKGVKSQRIKPSHPKSVSNIFRRKLDGKGVGFIEGEVSELAWYS